MTDAHDFDRDDALRARLRSADPAASLGPADPDGVARLLEDTMSHDTETPDTELRTSGTHGRGPLTWLVAAAAALVIGGVGVYALTGNDDDTTPPIAEGSDGADPSDQADQVVITQLRAPAASAGRCMVPTAETLAQQQLAFEATVDEITDGKVLLTPVTYYAGDQADRVEVSAPAESMMDLIGAVDFQVGGTYLVSATDGQVSACGFSGPVTPELEQLYTSAFPG